MATFEILCKKHDVPRQALEELHEQYKLENPDGSLGQFMKIVEFRLNNTDEDAKKALRERFNGKDQDSN